MGKDALSLSPSAPALIALHRSSDYAAAAVARLCAVAVAAAVAAPFGG